MKITTTVNKKKRLAAQSRALTLVKRHKLPIIIILMVAIIGSVLYIQSRAAVMPAAYPVKVSANKRYMVDQNNNPHFMAADTAWNLFSRVTAAEAAQYLDARKNQGFNTIMASIIDISAGGVNGANRAGARPFNNNNMGQPNAAYFDHVNTVLNLAKDRGMQVTVTTAWLSLAAKDGTFNTANMTTYGKYLGNRFQANDNVIWVMGGDWGGANEGICPRQPEVRALANAIKSVDTRHLMTYHPGLSYAGSTCYNGDSWLDLNGNYWDFNWNNFSSAYRLMYRDYPNTPTRPTFMYETGYENDTYSTRMTARTSRMQSYWMVLAGSPGFTSGATNAWNMVNGTRTWQSTITQPGGTYQGNVARFFTAFDWTKLVPDPNRTIVTAGFGTYGQEDYVTGARASDGSWVAAYTPTARTLTIDMSKLNGPATARWYDPTNNTYIAAGSNLANSGSRQFASPARNAAGDSDFALIISTGTGTVTPPPPGPVTPPPPPPSGQINQTGNLAYGKTFMSSALDHPTEAGYPVSNVNDANETSRWISAPQDNTTVSTDLGASYTLNKISVLWAADTIRNYDLQVSTNNSTWTTVASGTTNNTQKQLIDTTSFTSTPTGRYFRIVAKDRWNTSYGNSIYEIGVYGTAATSADTTPPTVSMVPPLPGPNPRCPDPVVIVADAADNVGVTRVDFIVDGVVTGSVTSTPYRYSWAQPTVGTHAVAVRAYDAAGNSASAGPVSLTYESCTTVPIAGDVNGDGRINALDLSALISHDGQNYPAADFNKDGTVGAADMAILLSRWTW
jgi:hypothetical protein